MKHSEKVELLNKMKSEILQGYGERFGLRIFIETGTLYGNRINSMLPYFDELYTIDIDRDTYEKAKSRFIGNPKVTCIFGDSREKLPELLKEIGKPALFWLDGHYFGGKLGNGKVNVPLMEELEAVLKHKQAKNHVIVIDDAKVFFKKWKGHDERYPEYEQIRKFILDRFPSWEVVLEKGLIRAYDAKNESIR